MTNQSKKYIKYTIKEFRNDFPDDEACLNYLFKIFYGALSDFDHYYLIRGRKEFVHSVTGEHISPLANTIFHKSSTPLTTWFEAIYKFANSTRGVSAKELQRDFGVTYKTAWRMASKIRTIFSSNFTNKLKCLVEADEVHIGANETNKYTNKKLKEFGKETLKQKPEL